MRIHELHPAEGAHKQKRRLGRGYGSGRGKTAGRGTKGQKARSGGKVPPWFEGGQTRLAKRLPKARGFVNRFRVEYEVINVSALERFESGATVTSETLVAVGLVKRDEKRPIKVLGDGKLRRALTVRVAKVSAGARAKIEAAGGTVIDDIEPAEDAALSAAPATEGEV
jgi:large subunit ribosomal protein L15